MKKKDKYSTNGYRLYVDIMTGKKLSSIYVANMDITYWSVHSSSRRGGRGLGKGCRLEDRYFSQLQVSLYIKVYNNMM